MHEEDLAKLIKFSNENLKHLDGPIKAALLKTAASYFEYLSHAEAQFALMQKSFNMLD